MTAILDVAITKKLSLENIQIEKIGGTTLIGINRANVKNVVNLTTIQELHRAVVR